MEEDDAHLTFLNNKKGPVHSCSVTEETDEYSMGRHERILGKMDIGWAKMASVNTV